MSLYHWFAEAYQWTPQQVDELTLDQVFWLPVMKEALSDAIQFQREKNN
jgi:hypothetical protein